MVTLLNILGTAGARTTLHAPVPGRSRVFVGQVWKGLSDCV